MKPKTAIRKIYDTVINLSLYFAIPLFFVILITSATQAFANLAYVANEN
jgi:hypothetical protein